MFAIRHELEDRVLDMVAPFVRDFLAGGWPLRFDRNATAAHKAKQDAHEEEFADEFADEFAEEPNTRTDAFRVKGVSRPNSRGGAVTASSVELTAKPRRAPPRPSTRFAEFEEVKDTEARLDVGPRAQQSFAAGSGAATGPGTIAWICSMKPGNNLVLNLSRLAQCDIVVKTGKGRSVFRELLNAATAPHLVPEGPASDRRRSLRGPRMGQWACVDETGDLLATVQAALKVSTATWARAHLVSLTRRPPSCTSVHPLSAPPSVHTFCWHPPLCRPSRRWRRATGPRASSRTSAMT